MHYFRVKNLEKFQHYKHRNPPWIRLYTDLINADDLDYSALTDTQKLHLIHIWMLATRHGNRVPMNLEWLQRRLNISDPIDLTPLLKAGFIEVIEEEECGDCGHASNMLADCKRLATPETETETETDSEYLHTHSSVSESEPEKPGAKPEPKPNPQEAALVEELKARWNDMADRAGLPRVRSIADNRLRAVRLRLKNHDWRDNYPTALEALERSDFCCGRVGTWRASFDWFIKPGTVTKLIEGQYANTRGSPRNQPETLSYVGQLPESERRFEW